MVRVILDTDIGTDVDDCLALAVVLGSPELQLEGITCVYGDVALRSRMVAKLLRLRGRDDVPLRLGAARPLLSLRDVYWAGHEGEGLLTPADPEPIVPNEHAVDFIIRTVLANPGEMHLLAIGPLTNVALALLKAPRIAHELAHLTVMGGVLRGSAGLDQPLAEHNFVCDPEAAHIVLSSGAPTTLVPLDVTTRVFIRRDGVQRLRGMGTPFHDAVAQQVELYPRFAKRGDTFLHDPLAAAIMIEPELVSTEALQVDIETEGRLARGVSFMRRMAERTPNVQVALAVNSARAEEFVMTRMTA